MDKNNSTDCQKNFENKLRVLIEIGNKLSRSGTVDGLCRGVVETGRDLLGFDRLAIWFISEDKEHITGSFGIDETGQLRYELGERVVINDDAMMKEIHAKKLSSIFNPDVPLRDHRGTVVGHGAHAIAAIWNGEEVIGYLTADTLLTKRNMSEQDRELLELYASIFGHLYSLKRAEEALQSAYSRLKDIQDELTLCTKMRLGGAVATGVVHEVKNPLAIIRRNVEYLIEKVGKKDKEVGAALSGMDEAAKRAENIVMGLIDFSRLTRLDLAPQNMNNVIDASIELLKHQIDKYNIKLVRDFGKDMPEVNIDRNKIEQAFVNIFLNAVYGMTNGGTIKIATYSHRPDDTVIAVIEDEGPGIPAEMISKIFDPFFTTRSSSGGTGMGLSVLKHIIDLHKGKVKVENRSDGHGVKVTLVFKV